MYIHVNRIMDSSPMSQVRRKCEDSSHVARELECARVRVCSNARAWRSIPLQVHVGINVHANVQYFVFPKFGGIRLLTNTLVSRCRTAF